MCYLGQCHRCNNFGHQQKDCKQNPTSFQQAVHEGGAGHSESLEKKSNWLRIKTPRRNVKENTREENIIEKAKEKAYNVTDNINIQDDMEQRNIKIKMDSACSRNMSGVGGRITDIQIADNTIKGFNGEESENLIW